MPLLGPGAQCPNPPLIDSRGSRPGAFRETLDNTPLVPFRILLFGLGQLLCGFRCVQVGHKKRGNSLSAAAGIIFRSTGGLSKLRRPAEAESLVLVTAVDAVLIDRAALDFPC